MALSLRLRVEAAVGARNPGVSANFHSSSRDKMFFHLSCEAFFFLYMATRRSL